jgi:multidrug efflux pump subunit AcrA (membrane-fusion protein)
LEATLPLTVRDAELSFEQAKITLEREQKRLKELETDGELLEIRSPMEGIVYYGRIQRGSWSAPSTASERLVPGSSADTNKVLMTIVQPRPLSVWVDVPENRLARLRVGLSGTAQLPVLPGTYLPAKVAELSPVPVREGTFAARIEVQIPEEARGVVPGGSCEVRFVPYLKQRTLVVPSSAVGTDELDPAKKFVYRLDAAGRVVRQPVTVGEQSGNLVEILDGLVAGDRILRNYSAGERYLDK